MKKIIIAAAMTLSSFALAAGYEIDSEHANANFAVKHLGINTVNGSLGTVTGKVNIDDKDITKSSVDVSIDPAAIYTGVAKRDGHLKSPDFFDVEKFKAVTFKSTKFEKNGDKLKITGDLTIKGTTKPVTLEATLSAEGPHAWPGKLVRAVSATGSINRDDFGLTWQVPGVEAFKVVGKEVKLAIDVELNRADPAAKPAEKPAAAPAKK